MSQSHLNTQLHVLLADDDVDDRFFFANSLTDLPFSIHLSTVKDGEELMCYLNKRAKNLPDVLFLDLSMPRKTGFECLTEIKEDLILRKLPVVVFTTSLVNSLNFETELIDVLANMGSLEFIRKQDDLEHLKETVSKILVNLVKKRDKNIK